MTRVQSCMMSLWLDPQTSISASFCATIWCPIYGPTWLTDWILIIEWSGSWGNGIYHLSILGSSDLKLNVLHDMRVNSDNINPNDISQTQNKITSSQASKECNRQEDFRKKPLQERKKRAGDCISSPAHCKVHSCQLIPKSSSSIFIIFRRKELFTSWCATVKWCGNKPPFQYSLQFLKSQCHNICWNLLLHHPDKHIHSIHIRIYVYIVATNKQTQLTTNATILTWQNVPSHSYFRECGDQGPLLVSESYVVSDAKQSYNQWPRIFELQGVSEKSVFLWNLHLITV